MKNIISLSLILILIVFASCNNDKRNLKSETYKAGIEIIDQMILTYRQMADVDYTSKYNQEMIAILSSSENIDNEEYIFTENSMEMIIALGTLKKVYAKYDLTADKNYTIKTAGLSEAIVAACNYLDSISITKESSKEIDVILDYVTASSFDETQVIQGLTNIFIDLWKTDVVKWQLLLLKQYKNYAEGIENISYDKFDDTKLSDFVDEPYTGKEVMVDIYKLNLKNIAYEDKEFISQKLEDLTWGIENINMINTEYSKKTPDEIYIENTIDNIKEYLLYEPKNCESDCE